MTLSKKQAGAIFDALTAPTRLESARKVALREQRQRRVTFMRWKLVAILAAAMVSAILHWFVLPQQWHWVIAILIISFVLFAQMLWNRKTKNDGKKSISLLP